MILERSKTPRTSLNPSEENASLKFEKENQQLSSKIESLNSELNQLRTNLANSNEIIDSLNITVFNAQQEVTKLTKDNEELTINSEKSSESLNATILDCNKNINLLKEEISTLRECEVNEQKLKEHVNLKDEEISALIKEIENFKASLENQNQQTVAQQLQQSNEQQTTKETEIESLTEKINSIKTNSEKLNENNRKLEEKLQEKTHQLSLLETQLLEFQEKIEAMKNEHDDILNEMRTKLTEKQSDQSNQVVHFQSLNNDLNEKLNENLNQIEILKQVETKINEQIKQLQSDLEDSSKATESMVMEKESLNRKIGELEATNSQLQNDLSNKSEVC